MELEWDGGAEREHPLPWLVPKNEREPSAGSPLSRDERLHAGNASENVPLVRNRPRQDLGQGTG